MTAPFGKPTVTQFDGPPQIEAGGARSWLTRGANFVVRYSRVKAGATLVRDDNPDEYFVLLHDAGAIITAGGATLAADPGSLVIVPPGRSVIAFGHDSDVTCVFSCEARDLAILASNAEVYAEGSDAGPLVSWPMPVGGYRLRAYRLSDYDRPDTLMRLFRTRNLMMNVFRPRDVPRDVTKLSPHWHDDFEQGSLCLAGTWTHHLRYPWTPDLTTWRPDEAVEVGSPSLTVIPSRIVHTSMNTNQGGSRLVDIFAPPRGDFSRRPGLVNNADEYPMPPELAALAPLNSAD